jgi:hypothetical protein
MRRAFNPQIIVLAIILGFGASESIAQAPSPAENGHSPAAVADQPAASVHNHTVKLSWGASVPASVPAGKSPRDPVVGYNVYRSTTSHDSNPKRINSKLCADTTYTDPGVEAGKTYFYVIRSVTAKGVESGPSNEARVAMPPL